MSMNRYDYDIDLLAHQEAVSVCTRCGTVHSRSPKPSPGTSWRTCEECDERTEHEIQGRQMEPREAAAELVARYIDKMGVIVHTDRRGYVIGGWVSEGGVSLANVSADWDLRVHEIGPIEAYNEDIREAAPDAEAYFNAEVEGVREDPSGYALPTYTANRDGVKVRDSDDLDMGTIRLCEIAGVELPEPPA